MAYLDLRDLSDELAALKDNASRDEDDNDRMEAIEELFREFSNIEDQLENETTLISETEFTEYAEDLAYDLGMVERDSSISYYVDWDRWASDLKNDYMSVDFDGETYLIRSY